MATKSGILTREDILAEVRAGKLIKGHAEENVHASSYDMRIGTVFDRGRRITNAQKGGEDAIVLQPGTLVLQSESKPASLKPRARDLHRVGYYLGTGCGLALSVDSKARRHPVGVQSRALPETSRAMSLLFEMFCSSHCRKISNIASIYDELQLD